MHICEKEKIKDETSKKIRETNGGQIKEQWNAMTTLLQGIEFLRPEGTPKN